MKCISFSQIQSLGITTEQCYKWVEDIIKTKKEMILPPKISLKPYDGVFCNVMPSIVSVDGKRKWGGVKVVNRYPHRVPSLESQILLIDIETGEYVALMDGTWITAMRTGAVAAHTIQLFAKNNYSVIGLIGLGNTVRSTLLMLLPRISNRNVTIKLLKYKGQEYDFISRFKQYKNVSFSMVDTPDDLVKGSDVVISGATYIESDLCANSSFNEGVLVVPIHTRGFTNCDLFFDKIYADDRDHVCHFMNFDSFPYFAEVCDVVNDKAIGRETDNERLIVYNIGISVHDIFLASQIYELILESKEPHSIIEVDMSPPNTKFWI